MRKKLWIFIVFSCMIPYVYGQPQPGDVFREYVWLPSMVKSEEGKFLRIGGRLDYKTNFDHFPENRQQNGYIPWEQYLELNDAIKAEVQIEKIGSHEDTRNLRISINKNQSMVFPDPEGIPAPASDYMHHTYPVVEIPLGHFNQGMNNAFRFDVDSTQRWDWPQNIVYGVILRIYYNPEIIKDKTGPAINAPGQKLSENQLLQLENPRLNIRQVDYLGHYEGINYEGDGKYRQWHYHYLRGQITHHIGSSHLYPYHVTWNTSWIPDQQEIKIAARIIYNSGLIHMTKPIDGLLLERDYHIALCKPYDQPKNWVTRQDDFESKFELNVHPEKITEARIYWVSWSPCYANGIYINDAKVFDREGPCYEYVAHEIALQNTDVLKEGINVIKTGKEPLHDGQMVHGMEVQWPGIIMKVKYIK